MGIPVLQGGEDVKSGRVSFVGAGPGAADLITLRGANRIAEADVVVWAASLVDPECVRGHARPDAELVDSSRITHEDVLEVYRRAAGQRLRVARVHSGDPALWGAVQEQYDACVRLGLDVEIVPGVSAFSAAAAVAGRELTVPEIAQSVILTRLEGGRTPMPDGEHIREFARHGTTMAVFLSAARSGQLVDELRAGGYADDTPVVIAYKVSWPDELVLHTTVGELETTVKQHKLWRHTLFLVGRSLRAEGTRSHLYHAGHFHTYRKADPDARRALRAVRDADDDAPKARAGWPLHASRSGWVAARVDGGGRWTGGHAASGQPAASGGQAASGRPLVGGQAASVGGQAASVGGQAASVAAWSAVNGWQATARAGRPPRAESTRPVKPVAKDQEALSFEPEQPAPAPEPRPEPAPAPASETARPAPRAAPEAKPQETPAQQAAQQAKAQARKPQAKRTNRRAPQAKRKS